MWLLLCSLASAQSWPNDPDWTPLTFNGSPMEDAVGDHGGLDESGDLSSAPDASVMSWHVNATDVYLRLQVRRSPINGASWFAPQDWAWLLDTDGDDSTLEAAVMVHADLVNTDVRIFTATGAAGLSPTFQFDSVLGDLGSSSVRTTGGGTEHYIDVQMTRAEAFTLLGWDDTTLVRVAGTNATVFALGWDDVAQCDASALTCDVLPDVLSDPIAIDQDGDSVVDPIEAIWGTDPTNADSDNDGLIDPLDFDTDPLFDTDGDGISDPLDPDSDGDGLLDGLEAGVTVFDVDTDPAENDAAPDADGSSTTSPWLADTDGGGLDDGVEDWNGDGAKGFWETDPNDPSDDVDTDADGIPDIFDGQDPNADIDDVDSDGDGIPDNVEFLYDTDGDNIPDFLDLDSDGDGISDEVETADDEDNDGIENFRDLDSDGDGILDEDEGAGDADGDTVPNFLDRDADSDGILDINEADEDEDGVLDDTDGDGIPDFLDNDLDSDGDGIPDNVEGDDDVDGDGLPNDEDNDSDGDGMLDQEEADRDEDGVLDDTDGDGTPDFLDTDSDGDGIPDSEELGDEDCDGLLDAIDPVFDEDLCDTTATTPGTDPTTEEPFETIDEGNPFAKPGQFTGGSCSVTGAAASPFAMLLGLLTLRRRRRTSLLAAAALLPATAVAQDASPAVNAQRLHPSVDGGSLIKVEDLEMADGGGLGAWMHYADDPFVYRPDDGTDPIDILGSVATLSLVGHYTFGVVRIGAELPVHVYSQGFGFDGPANLGDARISSKVRGINTDVFDLGAALDLSLPTGNQDAFVGAGSAVLDGRLLAALSAGPATFNGAIGARNGTGEVLGDLTVTPAVVWGVGTSLAIVEPTSLALEIDGEGWFGNVGQSGRAPIEWLASVRQQVGPGAIVLGGGTGLTKGVGAPDFRVLAGLMWASKPAEPAAPIVVPQLPPEPGRLVVRVTDPSGAAIPQAQVRVVGANQPLSEASADGVVERELPAASYEVTVAADGFVAANRMVDLKPGGTADLVLQLRAIDTPNDDIVVDKETNRIYLNRKVFFELDKAELKVESLAVLDRLVEVLVEHPDIGRVRIEGHTDSQGNDTHNLELSDQRAKSVKAYLIEHGVPADRLDAEGYGETRLLQQGESDEVHATNRRVEFHLLSE